MAPITARIFLPPFSLRIRATLILWRRKRRPHYCLSSLFCQCYLVLKQPPERAVGYPQYILVRALSLYCLSLREGPTACFTPSAIFIDRFCDQSSFQPAEREGKVLQLAASLQPMVRKFLYSSSLSFISVSTRFTKSLFSRQPCRARRCSVSKRAGKDNGSVSG